MTTNHFMRGNILVMAFAGWNDAGDAASRAVAKLGKEYGGPPVKTFLSEPYYDYQFHRPQLVMNEGVHEIEWPRVTLFGPRMRRAPRRTGAVVASTPRKRRTTRIFSLYGAEPSHQWMRFADDVVTAAQEYNIGSIITVGSMLADVPHTRPIPVWTTSDNEYLRAKYGLDRSTYEGPCGIMTPISHLAEHEGISVLNMWASVPHYAHNSPSPKAELALINRLEDFLDVTIPREDLAAEVLAWENRINNLAADDPDMAAYVRHLERARDTVDSPEASGEAIAEEFSRYLQQSDELET